jgi:glycosyltransferase involved in cell wall biosynthesis
MTVTVGIATLGIEPRLRSTVEGVLRSAALAGPEAEVLVVVNGRDRVPELHDIGSSMVRVRYLDRPNVAVARNTVLAEARHDTILFTDDDCAVPPEWCTQLAAGLREPETVAVGAPVQVEVAGPVSAYFDYQGNYNAVPIAPGGPLLLVTTNCGLRRDRIPASIRFDPRLFSAGEDTCLSLALGKAGRSVGWLADATPLRHGFTERISEITDRFVRNAFHGVTLYLEHGYVEASMPGVLAHYRQHLDGDSAVVRQFSELVAPEARTAFAAYEALSFAAMMVGYLDRLGTEFDHPLLELDRDGLTRAWYEIGERVRERTAALSPVDWAALEVDYRGMATRLGDAPDPMVDDVHEALRRYARPIPADPGGRIGDVLAHGTGELTTGYLDFLERVRTMYDNLCASAEPPTPDALDRAARGLGVSFKVACDAIEFSLRFDFPRLLRARRAGRQPKGVAA